MKVSTEIDNNFGYEKITQLVDNIPLKAYRLSELIFFLIKSCQYSLFVEEEIVLKSNRARTQTLTDSTRKRHKKEDLASFV
jgi:hypothetical protein